MPVIRALRKLRQEGHVFQASQGYIRRVSLKKEGKEEGRERGKKGEQMQNQRQKKYDNV
jgi:hypothetical protein